MPKHKHKHDKKSGSGGFHAKCAELARSTRAAFDDLVGVVSSALDDLEQDIGPDRIFANVRHNAEELFTRGKHEVQGFVRGTEVGHAEKALRQAEEGMKDLQHEAVKIGKGLGHLDKHIQHKAQEIWRKVIDWFSKIVEKIRHFMIDVKQHSMSAIFGGPGKKHDSHHQVPAPASPHHHKPKPQPKQ